MKSAGLGQGQEASSCEHKTELRRYLIYKCTPIIICYFHLFC
jgi:hypothetical protein